MVVVVLVTGGSLIALHAFNTLKGNNPELLERALFSIQQQAAVVSVFCAAIFGLVTALKTGRGVGSALSSTVPAGVPTSWGKPASQVAQAVPA